MAAPTYVIGDPARLGPLSLVSLGPVSFLRFGSASELSSRLFRASLDRWFHPPVALALSLDLLSLFEVSGFLRPARLAAAFPDSEFRLPWGFSAPEVGVSWLPEEPSLYEVSSSYSFFKHKPFSVLGYRFP